MSTATLCQHAFKFFCKFLGLGFAHCFHVAFDKFLPFLHFAPKNLKINI